MPSRSRFLCALALAAISIATTSAAEKSTVPQLIELAKSPGPALREAINATFDAKDLQGCAALMHDSFALEDPIVKRVEGKEAVLAVVAGMFESIADLQFRARNIFVDGNTSLIEFALTADGKVLTGVDVIEWRDGKMTELRAYLDVRFHDGEFTVAQSAGLEQHAVGDAHLADVVQRAGQVDQVHKVGVDLVAVVLIHAEAFGEEAAILAHPLEVCPCLRAATLGQLGQGEDGDVPAFQ